MVCRLGRVLLFSSWLAWVDLATAHDGAPFRVASGFRWERVADHDLVPDASCLTLDPAGRPVVAGPGYIRTLLPASAYAVDSPEADHSQATGVATCPSADSFVQAIDWLAGWPRQAAHGLHREGDHLYCVADGGLWRSMADAGGLQAASPPERLLTLKTGGEHDAHAIRRGPDGWWYLLAGNMATGIERLLNDPDSPVLEPRAGTLWRISPDWSRRTVWAHGLRNAYGFDFLPDGRPVTFDSDGERDVSLPWYRPTRVLLLNAGSDAGFVTRAWKDADHRPTMPTVLARLGRGSPTGVCYYDHPHFPLAYRRKLIVLDWTFGRVLAVDPWGSGDRERSTAVLVEPAGMVGFAPTAVVVEPSGALLISVGGRGTRGGLYRLSYEAGGELSSTSPTLGATPADQASTVVAPAVPNDPPGSLRQAQQLVAAGQKLPAASIDALLNDPDMHRQSAAWYLIGRQAVEATPEQWNRWRELALPSTDRWSEPAAPSGDVVSQVPARDRTTELSRMALELEARGLLRWPIGDWTLEGLMLDGDKVALLAQLRQLELWCRWRQTEASEYDVSAAAATAAGPSWSDALAGGLYATVQQRERWTDELPWLARLDPSQSPLGRQQAVEQLTGLQLALGDLRWELPGLSFVERPPSVFDGYRGCSELGWSEAQRRRWLIWLQACGELAEERGWDGVLEEVVRTVAMLGLLSDADGDWVAGWLGQDRPPDFQVLCMLALASGSAQLSTRCQEQLAEAWLGLGDSLRSWDAQVDNHWEPRLLELFDRLLVCAPRLATLLVEHPSFTTQDQSIAWWWRLPDPSKSLARDRMREQLLTGEPSTWRAQHLEFVLQGGVSSELRSALYRAAELPHLQRLVYRQLATSPQPNDHATLVAGLVVPGREVPLAAWRGLSKLGPATDPAGELPPLLELMQRSETGNWTEPNRSELMERLATVFQRLGLSIPPPQSRLSATAWIGLAEPRLSRAEAARLSQLATQGDWSARIARLTQLAGEPGAGRELFERAGCGACHGGGIAPGPDLKGVTQRFAVPDLMRAIYDPSADVSDRYRPLQVLTQAGTLVVGLPVYRSADGVTLQTAQGETLRINQDEIERQEPSQRSLMPDGLLDGWSDQQLADLLAYLRQL